MSNYKIMLYGLIIIVVLSGLAFLFVVPQKDGDLSNAIESSELLQPEAFELKSLKLLDEDFPEDVRQAIDGSGVKTVEDESVREGFLAEVFKIAPGRGRNIGFRGALSVVDGEPFASGYFEFADFYDGAKTHGFFNVDNLVPGIEGDVRKYYVVKASGVLRVKESGFYLFAAGHNNGGAFRIDLNNDGKFGGVETGIYDVGMSMAHQKVALWSRDVHLTGRAYTQKQAHLIFLFAGQRYPFEWIWYRNLRGVGAELYYSRYEDGGLAHPWVLVGDGEHGVDVVE